MDISWRKYKMELYNEILQDLKDSLTETSEKKEALKVIVAEFQRQAKPITSDKPVVAILVSFRKKEREALKAKKEECSVFLDVVSSYLPPEASVEEIKTWIKANIDFTKLKSKGQAIGKVMGNFGAKTDGDTIKGIIAEL